MKSLEGPRGRRAATAACVVAMALGAGGMVMAVVDDSRPVIMHTAAAPTPERHELALRYVDVPYHLPAPGEETTPAAAPTSVARRSAPAAVAEAGDEDPYDGWVSVPSPNDPPAYSTEAQDAAERAELAADRSEAAATRAENAATQATTTTTMVRPVSEPEPTITTTTAPAPQVWVEVARFEWTGRQADILRQSVELAGTGRLRVQTSYSTDPGPMRIGLRSERLWWDDGTDMPTDACPSSPENPGTTLWAGYYPDCPGYAGPWPLGQHTLLLGEFVDSNAQWAGPQRPGALWLTVEELR